jgi:glycosyltransferase involved in cell wall biosynthesis
VAPKPTLLIISQVYPPDPAAVGPYLADAGAEMARRGYRVVVLTSANGYDDSSMRYPRRERRDGVEVRRLSLSSFGKSSLGVRLLAQSFFLLRATVAGLALGKLAGVLVSTSPPFCGLAGVVIGRLRRIPVTYWLMDLNPDQAIAMRWIGDRSIAARVFERINRAILKQATQVVVLDRFMAERVFRKLDVRDKTTILPPWPHVDAVECIPHEENPFRRDHGLEGRCVVMYAGNHSPVNPIRTLLDAAARLQDDPRLLTVWIGGGGGKAEVEEAVARGVRNVRSLPYQPFDRIRFSLSAADVHAVSLGDEVVGIVHPCKAYGAMAMSRPLLFFGPRPCHVSELIEKHGIGWQVRHGDVEGAVRVLREILATPRGELEAMGRRAGEVVAESLSRTRLMGEFCDLLQAGLPRPEAT